MTAGSYMYIGPQGIVHGTTITVLNGFRKIKKSPSGSLFVTSGLGGMSGAQPKAGTIAGCVTVCAEVNPKITKIRHEQGWIHEVIEDLDQLITRTVITSYSIHYTKLYDSMRFYNLYRSRRLYYTSCSSYSMFRHTNRRNNFV